MRSSRRSSSATTPSCAAGRSIVGGGRRAVAGVVSAASYEARRFGVHSAMSMREAVRRCPTGCSCQSTGAATSRRAATSWRSSGASRRRSSRSRSTRRSSTSPARAALFGDGPTIAAPIKDAVRADVGLTASVGVATNKLVAKIASDLRKPDGLVVVPAGEEAAFLAPLPIGRLWGVGEKTAVALADYGVRTIGDLAALPPDLVVRPVRQARRLAASTGRAGSTPIRSTTAIRRSRSATSTRSMSTRAIPRSSSGRCSRWPTGSPAGCVPPACARRRSRSRSATRRSARSPASGRCRPDRSDRAHLSWRPRAGPAGGRAGIRVRLLGVSGSEPRRSRAARPVRADDPRHRRAVEAADAVRRRYGEAR